MGYSTYFSLEFQTQDDELINERPLILNTLNESPNAVYALGRNNQGGEGSKWYDFADDMRAISLKHPRILFKLHGEGEENADIWDAYFLGGKMQLCKATITIPPYDVSQLK